MAIGLAIIGLEPVVTDEHIPAAKESDCVVLKAVYSRSQDDAQGAATRHGVDAYYDSPEESDRSLDALLKRLDFKAVVIALPVGQQHKIVLQALTAGKHVLSEKPISKDVATAERMLDRYHSRGDEKVLWSVGENARFKEPVLFAYRQLKNLKGCVDTFTVKKHRLVARDAGSSAPSRNSNAPNQESFVMGVGLHCAAVLRLLLSALNESIIQVAAFHSNSQRGQSPKDIVNATLQLSNGNSGTINFSYGTEFETQLELQIITDKGVVALTDNRVSIITDNEDGTTQQEAVRKFPAPDNSFKRQIEVFGEGIKRGKVEQRGLPQEALEDLKIVQAIFESGEKGGSVVEIE